MTNQQFANLVKIAREYLENMIERESDNRKHGDFPHELLAFCERQAGDPKEVADLISGR